MHRQSDIGAILETAVGAAADAVKKTAPQVEDFLREIGRGHEDAIKAIAEAFADGDIAAATTFREGRPCKRWSSTRHLDRRIA